MDKEALKKRTKEYALGIVRLVETFPRSAASKAIGNQLLRSGTSVGANYRAALRARSRSEFVAKLGIVIEEADESMFWLELVAESGILEREVIKPLYKETDEILAIMIATSKSSRKKQI